MNKLKKSGGKVGKEAEWGWALVEAVGDLRKEMTEMKEVFTEGFGRLEAAIGRLEKGKEDGEYEEEVEGEVGGEMGGEMEVEMGGEIGEEMEN